jgi:hypothetical protein
MHYLFTYFVHIVYKFIFVVFVDVSNRCYELT